MAESVRNPESLRNVSLGYAIWLPRKWSEYTDRGGRQQFRKIGPNIIFKKSRRNSTRVFARASLLDTRRDATFRPKTLRNERVLSIKTKRKKKRNELGRMIRVAIAGKVEQLESFKKLKCELSYSKQVKHEFCQFCLVLRFRNSRLQICTISTCNFNLII